jgi:hypothetical protein
MMRRTSTPARALLGLCVLGLIAGLPAAASAAPTITVKATPVPVPINLSSPHSATYPGTGAIAGAPFSAEFELSIHGSEYGGAPSPLTQIKVWVPAGVKLSTRGFATCMEATIKETGAEACPKKSFAGPQGEARGEVSFGSERVYETVSLQGFFAPGGGLIFFADGRTPAVIEVISKGTVSSASGPFGEVFTGEVPLVESVPGALDASVEFIKVKIGAAYKQGKKLISYLTAPKTCPKGGFPIKTETTFLSGETVPASYTYPCPKHKK